jgi:hypothetical protein
MTIPRTGSARLDGKLDGEAPTSLFQDKRGRIWVATTHKFGYLENGRFESCQRNSRGSRAFHRRGQRRQSLDRQPGCSDFFTLSQQNQVQQIPWSRLGHKDHATALAADPSGAACGSGSITAAWPISPMGKCNRRIHPPTGLARALSTSFNSIRTVRYGQPQTGGLSRLKNGQVATLTSKNGLPCDGVHWMMADDAHSLWLNMPCGLVRIARSELDAWAAAVDNGEYLKRTIQVTVFDSLDGVRSLAFAGGYTPHVAKSWTGSCGSQDWTASASSIRVIFPSTNFRRRCMWSS